MYGDPTVKIRADDVAKEREPQHPLQPEGIANGRADDHRNGHSQERRPRDRSATLLVQAKVDPSAGRMSPRVTNENAEATRAMQLATNNRRGFMRSVSGATTSPPIEEVFGLAD